MRWKTFLYLPSALLVVLSSSLFFTSGSADATSAYDNVITTTDNITIQASLTPTYNVTCSPAILTTQSDGPLTSAGFAKYTDRLNALSGQPTLSSLMSSYQSAKATGTVAITASTLWTSSARTTIQDRTYTIWWTATPNKSLSWYSAAVGTSGSDWYNITLESYNRANGSNLPTASGGCGTYIANYLTGQNFVAGSQYNSPSGQTDIFTYSGNPNYPTGYAGANILSTYIAPVHLKPTYTFSVDKTGELQIKYEKNISPFLTGITTTALDKMTNNWGALDTSGGTSTIWTNQANPAGFLEQSTTLTVSGYYMLHFTHNQQLDSPPWDSTKRFYIDEAWVQFYWDGHSVVNGTTDCPGQSICNPTKKADQSPFGSMFDTNSYGLTAAVNAPISAISTLSSKTCSTIDVPFASATLHITCLSSLYNIGVLATVIPIYQTVLTGLIAYWLAIKVIGHTKKLSDPDDDSIDVVDL